MKFIITLIIQFLSVSSGYSYSLADNNLSFNFIAGSDDGTKLAMLTAQQQPADVSISIVIKEANNNNILFFDSLRIKKILITAS